MIQKIKSQNISLRAFTLIEMVVVLIIIWIMLMATVFLSWEQIQKVKNKTVKESIIAEMQTRYSRNLWSSSFASWIMYDTMDVTFSSWTNEIKFEYNAWNDNTGITNTFTDRFEIKYITTDYDYTGDPGQHFEDITLHYSPYKISCQIWSGEEYTKIVFIARVNENKNYCFEISQQNCRLVEVSDTNCGILEKLVHLDN